MKRLTAIILTIVILSAASAANVYAMGVDIPFDYHISRSTIPAYAKASNDEVVVEAGYFGLIETASSAGEIMVIKNVCYEDIYWLIWTGTEFIGFTENYMIRSEDGYSWTKTEDINNLEHEKYGVSKEKNPFTGSTVGYIDLTDTVDSNHFTYVDDSGQQINVTIFNTGKEYLKFEDCYVYGTGSFIRTLYKSDDRKEWEYVKTSGIDDNSLKNIGTDNIQIINDGKEYLIRNTEFDNSKNIYNQKRGVGVYNFNLELVKPINFTEDNVVDMSYMENTYYITTEAGATYRSVDLDNWEIVGENLGAPIANDQYILYKTRTDIQKGISIANKPYAYEAPILCENGNPAKNIILENITPFGTQVCGDYFVCFTNASAPSDEYNDYSAVKDLDGETLKLSNYISDKARVSFSKDGIYWATIELPVNDVKTIEFTDEAIIIYSNSAQVYFSIKFSDMEQVVPACDTKVQLNDHILGFSQPPVTENDRALVPMRFLFEQMGAAVTWDDATQTATATVPVTTEEEMQTFGLAEENTHTFSVDNTTATVNGSAATMDDPARLINDKTMVPLRFLSENLGFNVHWDEATRTAIVTTE